MPGSVFRSERFVISVDCGSLRRKIFQCQFAKRDGSVFVNFPYFRHSEGVVSLVEWPADQPSTTLSLETAGRVSSHLVKYAHHPSGRAHFSQDGKVLTLVKKNAVPLAELEGHLFTLHVHASANAWGNGYATEALQAMVDVSRSIGLVRLYALCHPQHRASWRVLEKCGFRRDERWSRQAQFPNLAPGLLQDVVCYELE